MRRRDSDNMLGGQRRPGPAGPLFMALRPAPAASVTSGRPAALQPRAKLTFEYLLDNTFFNETN